MEVYWTEAVKLYASFRSYVNKNLRGFQSFEIIVATACITFVVTFIWFYIFQHRRKGLFQRLKEWLFSVIRLIPVVNNHIKLEISKAQNEIEKHMLEDLKDEVFLQQLPRKGQSKEDIMKQVHDYQSLGKVDWPNGRASGAIYKAEDKCLRELVSETYHSMAWTNPLHPDVFPSVRKMEAEIVRMVCNLYHGDEASCGTVTSGGTESIFMACKAYRDYAFSVRGIEHPEMIIPTSAHAAFEKAAHVLQIKFHHIPLDKKTMRVDIKAMRSCITSNTCMLVGSAPQYPHGVIDPIEDISKLGLKYKIPVHVDACLGGFLIPFMKEAGFSLPPFDFSLKGVTSISCDTHKYGYAPKGTSVIMYRNKLYRHHQYSIIADWPGGIYATPVMGGSRSGGAIGTCWVSLLYYGVEGYVQSTKKIVNTARFIEREIRAISGLFVFGNPQVSVVAVGSQEFNIYRLSQALTRKGWNLNPVQLPPGFHICITQLHTAPGVAEQLIQDIQECTKIIMEDPKAPATGTAAIYGMAQSIPDTLVDEICTSFLDCYYSTSFKEQENGLETKKHS